MGAQYAELHDELRSVAEQLLGKERADWAVLAQAGWTGLEAPESVGGAGASFAEVAVILEEIGRAAASTDYLGGAVLGVEALNMVQGNAVRDDLLSGVVSGETRVAVALAAGEDTAPFRLEGSRLSGRAEFVPDAVGAHRLLVPAVQAGGDLVLIAVDPAAVQVAAQPVLDQTRSLAVVTADAVPVDESAARPFDGAGRLRDRAALAIACDSLGLAEAMLAATVSYAGVRNQFGRPIGSFQAVKHACADMHVQVEVARELVRAAVDAVTEEAADHGQAIARAKAYACEVAVAVTGKAMQLHGGIGYTWESDVHVYLKRAMLNRALFGSPASHRRRLAMSFRGHAGRYR